MNDDNTLQELQPLTELPELPPIGPSQSDRFPKIQLLFSILAGLVTVILCLLLRASLFEMALWTSAAIVLFWFLGNLVRYYLQTEVFPTEEEPPYDFEETPESLQPTDTPLANTPGDTTNDYMARE